VARAARRGTSPASLPPRPAVHQPSLASKRSASVGSGSRQAIDARTIPYYLEKGNRAFEERSRSGQPPCPWEAKSEGNR
jgi:hypothetical protein